MYQWKNFEIIKYIKQRKKLDFYRKLLFILIGGKDVLNCLKFNEYIFVK